MRGILSLQQPPTAKISPEELRKLIRESGIWTRRWQKQSLGDQASWFLSSGASALCLLQCWAYTGHLQTSSDPQNSFWGAIKFTSPLSQAPLSLEHQQWVHDGAGQAGAGAPKSTKTPVGHSPRQHRHNPKCPAPGRRRLTHTSTCPGYAAHPWRAQCPFCLSPNCFQEGMR